MVLAPLRDDVELALEPVFGAPANEAEQNRRDGQNRTEQNRRSEQNRWSQHMPLACCSVTNIFFFFFFFFFFFCRATNISAKESLDLATQPSDRALEAYA